MAKSKENLPIRLAGWQISMEKGGLKVIATEAMVSAKRAIDEEAFEIEDIHQTRLKQEDKIKYLGGKMMKEGGTEDDVRERIKLVGRSGKKLAV
eukprot:gene1674-16150_t